jgi:23S rRNA (guanosine2251-2'-O)-methyltransferase
MSDWIVGYHAVTGALASKRPLELLWLQRGRRDRRLQELRAAARDRGVVATWVSRRRLDEVAGDRPHNGCAVRTSPVEMAALEDVIAAADRPGRLLLLDGVGDPHNLGAALRSAVAFGVDGVIIAGPSAPPLGAAVARSAAGLLERVPLVRLSAAADALSRLRGSGYWALGADSAGAEVSTVRSIDRWVLAIGAEDRGLRARTRSEIDEMLRIPIVQEVDSLNLSVATGILLYHLCCLWPAEQ